MDVFSFVERRRKYKGGGGDVCFLASFISLGLKKVKTNREKRRREGERQCSAVGERHFEL